MTTSSTVHLVCPSSTSAVAGRGRGGPPSKLGCKGKERNLYNSIYFTWAFKLLDTLLQQLVLLALYTQKEETLLSQLQWIHVLV